MQWRSISQTQSAAWLRWSVMRLKLSIGPDEVIAIYCKAVFFFFFFGYGWSAVRNIILRVLTRRDRIMSDVKKRIVKFFLTGNSFILFCASFFSGISSKRKSAFWWIHGIVLARFHHQNSAVLPSMRFERGERSPFDSSCASKKHSSHVGVRVQKLKAKVLSVPLLPVSSLPSRGSSIAPILAPIGRVRATSSPLSLSCVSPTNTSVQGRNHTARYDQQQHQHG